MFACSALRVGFRSSSMIGILLNFPDDLGTKYFKGLLLQFSIYMRINVFIGQRYQEYINTLLNVFTDFPVVG